VGQNQIEKSTFDTEEVEGIQSKAKVQIDNEINENKSIC
jgi:hypothetical protein